MSKGICPAASDRPSSVKNWAVRSRYLMMGSGFAVGGAAMGGKKSGVRSQESGVRSQEDATALRKLAARFWILSSCLLTSRYGWAEQPFSQAYQATQPCFLFGCRHQHRRTRSGLLFAHPADSHLPVLAQKSISPTETLARTRRRTPPENQRCC